LEQGRGFRRRLSSLKDRGVCTPEQTRDHRRETPMEWTRLESGPARVSSGRDPWVKGQGDLPPDSGPGISPAGGRGSGRAVRLMDRGSMQTEYAAELRPRNIPPLGPTLRPDPQGERRHRGEPPGKTDGRAGGTFREVGTWSRLAGASGGGCSVEIRTEVAAYFSGRGTIAARPRWKAPPESGPARDPRDERSFRQANSRETCCRTRGREFPGPEVGARGALPGIGQG